MHWPLVILVLVIAAFGFLMLYSVAEGDFEKWARPQIERFVIGFAFMLIIGFIHIDFWRVCSPFVYFIGIFLLIFVLFFGDYGGGARRWLEFGSFRFQPSEVIKVGLVMFLAIYYDWLQPEKVSKIFWVFIPAMIILLPTALVIPQPDLGTGTLIAITGLTIMFVAGGHYLYFLGGLLLLPGLLGLIFYSRGTSWQLVTDYQFGRIDTFLNPTHDPLGEGYQITQSKIALGSGGLEGKGFMQGSQSQLDFLPQKHTDFIFTTIAEEFGFFGGVGLLLMYSVIIIFCVVSAITNKNKFGSLLTIGLATVFFTYFFINIAAVTGMAPVTGVPLPLISYGGSAMLVVLGTFGLIQSAHIHRLLKRD
ncbi:MAG: rod shape-determining protein RodA [Rhodobacteraceae bacterium]|nr:MAG: rod shape-determining protein RodA [Paracoccaceae bacterium]